MIAFASVGGSGFFPVASGTVGSAAALALYWFVTPLHTWWICAVAIVAVLLAGVPASGAMERWRGPDPASVVVDELAGMWVSMLFLPLSWKTALAAFLLFRLFDIIKPPPARQFDRMHGGFGIMMDDVAAGVYANLVVRLGLLVFPS